MKQVVKVIESDLIDINNVVQIKYYGFSLFGYASGMIVGDDMISDKNTYQAKFFHQLTGGNPWTTKFPSLKACIENILEQGCQAKIFEFDTHQELFLWACKV